MPYRSRSERLLVITAIVIPSDIAQPMRLEQLDEHTPGGLRRLVEGNLERVDLYRPSASVYLNEEGKLDGLPINRRATTLLWVHNSRFRGQDVLVGTTVVVGPSEAHGDDTSAPDDLIDLLFERCTRCGAYVYAGTTLVYPANGQPCADGTQHVVDPSHRTRYRVQVQVRGETTWHGNQLVFADWFDAYTYGIDLAQRWTQVMEVRVVPDLDDKLLESWYQLGLAEPSIRAAEDRPFTKARFTGCDSVDELAEQISAMPWPAGTAFYYRDLCFIQQANGGDEWLAIRHETAFETMALAPSLADRTFASLVRRLLAASKEQLEQHTY